MLVDLNRNKKGVIGLICGVVMSFYIGKDGRDYVRIMKIAIEIMLYVHFSERFTPQEYFECKRVPSHKELELYWQVFMAMVHKS